MKIDDPIFALSVHGAAGVWDTLSNGLFATEELATVGIVKQGCSMVVDSIN